MTKHLVGAMIHSDDYINVLLPCCVEKLLYQSFPLVRILSRDESSHLRSGWHLDYKQHLTDRSERIYT